MTNPQSSLPLLTDIERTQKRTRRRLDDSWFTYGLLGAAMMAGGVATVALGEGWGVGVLLAAVALAYVAIAWRFRRNHALVPRCTGSRVPRSAHAVSAALVLGFVGIILTFDGQTERIALSLWSALGFLTFAVLWSLWPCYVMAAAALVVAADYAVAPQGPAVSSAIYGGTLALIGVIAWLKAGRRTR